MLLGDQNKVAAGVDILQRLLSQDWQEQQAEIDAVVATGRRTRALHLFKAEMFCLGQFKMLDREAGAAKCCGVSFSREREQPQAGNSIAQIAGNGEIFFLSSSSIRLCKARRLPLFDLGFEG